MLCGSGAHRANVSYRPRAKAYFSCTTLWHEGEVRRKRLQYLSYIRHENSAPSIFEPRSSIAAIASGTDINTIARHSSDRPLRIRGGGKLLSVYHGMGLALLRAEQVEAVVNGQGELVLDSNGDTSWKLQPWWPDVWPTATDSGT